MYSREAWEKTIFANIDRLLEAARAVQSDIAVSYEQIMPIVRGSDLPICKVLIQELEAEYEMNINANTPGLVRDIQAFYGKHPQEKPVETQRKVRKAGSGVRVQAERTTVKAGQTWCLIP